MLIDAPLEQQSVPRPPITKHLPPQETAGCSEELTIRPNGKQDWQKISSTKAVNRYYPPAVRAAVTELLIARERHQVCMLHVSAHLTCSCTCCTCTHIGNDTCTTPVTANSLTKNSWIVE